MTTSEDLAREVHRWIAVISAVFTLVAGPLLGWRKIRAKQKERELHTRNLELQSAAEHAAAKAELTFLRGRVTALTEELAGKATELETEKSLTSQLYERLVPSTEQLARSSQLVAILTEQIETQSQEIATLRAQLRSTEPSTNPSSGRTLPSTTSSVSSPLPPVRRKWPSG